MVGVAGKAIALHFGVDLRAAGLGVLVFLEHQYAGAFAHDETVAVLVIGARSPLGRIIEAGGQGPAGHEAGDAEGADRSFGPAGDHHIRVAAENES